MSIITQENSKKWLNSVIVITAVLVGYLVIKFSGTMGELFDLESKIPYFLGVSQGIGIISGLIFFLYITKNKFLYGYLEETYSELTKAIWPNVDQVYKTTISIVIGVAIVSGVLIVVDKIFRFLLSLIY